MKSFNLEVTLGFPEDPLGISKDLFSLLIKETLMVKNPPANAGDVKDVGLILVWEYPLEAGMTTYSSILAWRIPWTEKPGQLQS